MGSWQAGVDARDIAPVQRVGQIGPRPIMIIHGDQDEMFSVDNAYLLFQAASDPKELWVMPGVAHPGPGVGPYGTDPQAYVGRVGRFLDAALM